VLGIVGAGLFASWVPLLSPNQQRQNTKGVSLLAYFDISSVVLLPVSHCDSDVSWINFVQFVSYVWSVKIIVSKLLPQPRNISSSGWHKQNTGWLLWRLHTRQQSDDDATISCAAIKHYYTKN